MSGSKYRAGFIGCGNMGGTLASVCARAVGGCGVALYDPDTKNCEGLEGRTDVVFTSIVYEDQSLPSFATEAMSAYALS